MNKDHEQRFLDDLSRGEQTNGMLGDVSHRVQLSLTIGVDCEVDGRTPEPSTDHNLNCTKQLEGT